MDLSVISVVLVSSRRTRGLVSINLIRNGVLQFVVVIFICGELIATLELSSKSRARRPLN
jgi:hypothetical protein